MSKRWSVRIEVWPYFGVEQAAAGEASQLFYVDADDIYGAMKCAEHIQVGLQASPAVWQAPIVSVSIDDLTFRRAELAPCGKLEISTVPVSSQDHQPTTKE